MVLLQDIQPQLFDSWQYTTFPFPINTNPDGLLPRHPGAKHSVRDPQSSHLVEWLPILSQKPWETIVESFAGGLWLVHAFLQAERPTVKTVVCAENDPALRGNIACLKDSLGRRFVKKRIKCLQSLSLGECWDIAKYDYEYGQATGIDSPDCIAAGLAIKILSFSGITRDGVRSGKLNVKAMACQKNRWQNYTPSWPTAPERLIVHDDYRKIQPIADPDLTIELCDPPYVGDIPQPTRASGRYLSPAYFGHRPHEQWTADLATDSVERAMQRRSGLIIGCNYDAPWLHEAYIALAEKYGYSCDRTIRKALTGLNNNAKPTDKENGYIDAYWVFHRKNLGVMEAAA